MRAASPHRIGRTRGPSGDVLLGMLRRAGATLALVALVGLLLAVPP
jgi:hypothetical protein